MVPGSTRRAITRCMPDLRRVFHRDGRRSAFFNESSPGKSPKSTSSPLSTNGDGSAFFRKRCLGDYHIARLKPVQRYAQSVGWKYSCEITSRLGSCVTSWPASAACTARINSGSAAVS